MILTAGPTLARDAHYRALWLLAVREAGVPEEELAAARERMTHDRFAPLAAQLTACSRIGLFAPFKSGTRLKLSSPASSGSLAPRMSASVAMISA